MQKSGCSRQEDLTNVITYHIKSKKKMTKGTRNDLAKLSEKCPSTLKKTTQLGGIFDPKKPNQPSSVGSSIPKGYYMRPSRQSHLVSRFLVDLPHTSRYFYIHICMHVLTYLPLSASLHKSLTSGLETPTPQMTLTLLPPDQQWFIAHAIASHEPYKSQGRTSPVAAHCCILSLAHSHLGRQGNQGNQ